MATTIKENTTQPALTLFPSDRPAVRPRRRQEWELDAETCEIGLNAIAKLRATLNN